MGKINYFAYPGAVKTVNMMKEHTITQGKFDIEDFLILKIQEFEQVSLVDLLGSRRQQDIVAARQLLGYLMYTHSKYSLQDIGKFIHRDHATIIHGCRVVQKHSDTEVWFNDKRLMYLELLNSGGYDVNPKRLEKYPINPIATPRLRNEPSSYD